MAENNNILRLTGVVKEVNLAYTDEERDEKFYYVIVEVNRLSDNVDTLPVICSEKLLYDVTCEPGSLVTISGYVRTRNFLDAEGHSHLEVFGYAYRIENVNSYDEIDAKTNNVVKISGFICRPVRQRKTFRTKRDVTDIVVAVNRPYARRDYVPCIAWSRNAVLAGNRSMGDKIQVTGRFQSRQYRRKDSEELMTAYEVSVLDLKVLESVTQEKLEEPEEPEVQTQEEVTVEATETEEICKESE